MHRTISTRVVVLVAVLAVVQPQAFACRHVTCMGGCASELDPDWGVIPYMPLSSLLSDGTSESCACPAFPALMVTNGGPSCPGTTSSEPILYADGGAVFRTPVVSFSTAGGPASFYLSYNNRPVDAGAVVDEGFGLGWAPNIPHMEVRADGGDPEGLIYFVVDGLHTWEFRKDAADTWNGVHGLHAKIVRTATDYELWGTNGGKVTVPRNAVIPIGLGVRSIQDPYGNTWEYFYHTSGRFTGRVSSFVDPAGRFWMFSWNDMAGVGPRVVSLSVIEGGTTLATCGFSYFSFDIPGVGKLGDLRNVTFVDYRSQGRPSRIQYFRYYTQIRQDGSLPQEDRGNPHDLRYVVGFQHYAELYDYALAQGKMPDTVTDAEIEANGFHEMKLGYDAEHRVIGEVVGKGCGCGGGGQTGYRTYYYQSYCSQDSGGDYNTWAHAVERWNPDGSLTQVEVNDAGAVITMVHVAGTTSRAMRFKYDEAGHVTEIWQPSACNIASYQYPSSPGNEVTTNANAGVVEKYEYYEWNPAVAGWENMGRLARKQLVNLADAQNPRTLYEFIYDVNDQGEPVEPDAWDNGGNRRPYKVKHYSAPGEGGVGMERVFGYTWANAEHYALATKTVTHPAVTSPEGKPATKVVETFDSQGSGQLLSIGEYEGTTLLRTTEFGYATGTGEKISQTITAAGGGLSVAQQWTHTAWGDVESHTINGTPLQRKRWVQSSLAKGGGYQARYVTLGYDHVVENGQTATREGLVTLTVTDLDGRVVETATGYIPVSDTNIADDFNRLVSDLKDAFIGSDPARKLYMRTSSEFEGELLVARRVWTKAEDAAAPKYETFWSEEYEGELLVKKEVKATDVTSPTPYAITKSYFDEFGRLVQVKTGTAEDNLTVVKELFYDYAGDSVGEGFGNGYLTRIKDLIAPAAGGAAAKYRVTRLGYDWHGRQIWQASWEGDSSGSIDARAEVATQAYDDMDRVVESASFQGYWVEASKSWQPYYAAAELGRLWKTVQVPSYDERSRVWRSQATLYKVTASGLEAGNTYTTTTWRDALGNVSKSQGADVLGASPEVAFVKYGYDAIGRRTAVYEGYDPDEGATADSALSGDVILVEEQAQLDGAGRALATTRYERKAGETTSWPHYGRLSDSGFAAYVRKTFSAVWYDSAGRTIAAADYGTNSATRPDTPPAASSATCLVSKYEYGFGVSVFSGQDASWFWLKATDARGQASYRFLDSLGRQVHSIGSFTGSGEPGSETNLASRAVYDALGRVTSRTAVEKPVGGGGASDQTTQYQYGVSTADAPIPSAIATRALLRKIVYADGGEVTFAYDALGRVKWRRDRNNTVRQFEYLPSGALGADKVSSWEVDGGNPKYIDIAVRRHGYEYDSFGRVVSAKSFSSADGGAGTEVNTIAYEYGLNGMLTRTTQAHLSGIPSRDVVYSWTTPTVQVPEPRLSQLTYPGSGRFLYYRHSATGADWEKKDYAVGRVSWLSLDVKNVQKPAIYTYMGVGTPVKVSNSMAGIDTSFLDASGSLGFDEFGRVKRMLSTRSPETYMDLTFAYDYTKSVDAPVSRVDAGPLGAPQSQWYTYDPVERLKVFKRGANEGTPDFTRTWDLTALGNWQISSPDNDQRGHNAVNEILGRTVNGQMVRPVIYPLFGDSYDPEGNLREVPADNAAALTDYFPCKYDAWNRLVRVEKDSVSSQLTRDALGRIVKAIDQSGAQRHFYWSEGWQLLSVYDGAGVLQKENVWGVRYVDDAVCTWDNVAGRWRHYVQDANWNVTAVYDGLADDPLELVTYDPYGMPKFWKKVSGVWTEQTAQLVSRKGAEHLFQGRWLWSWQSGTPAMCLRLYDFRSRAYASTLGRFLQSDPIGPWGDIHSRGNTFLFERAMPVSSVDPLGLEVANGGPDVGGWIDFLRGHKELMPQRVDLQLDMLGGSGAMLKRDFACCCAFVRMEIRVEAADAVKRTGEHRRESQETTIRCEYVGRGTISQCESHWCTATIKVLNFDDPVSDAAVLYHELLHVYYFMDFLTWGATAFSNDCKRVTAPLSYAGWFDGDVPETEPAPGSHKPPRHPGETDEEYSRRRFWEDFALWRHWFIAAMQRQFMRRLEKVEQQELQRQADEHQRAIDEQNRRVRELHKRVAPEDRKL